MGRKQLPRFEGATPFYTEMSVISICGCAAFIPETAWYNGPSSPHCPPIELCLRVAKPQKLNI